jgi:hypothetical protein
MVMLGEPLDFAQGFPLVGSVERRDDFCSDSIPAIFGARHRLDGLSTVSANVLTVVVCDRIGDSLHDRALTLKGNAQLLQQGLKLIALPQLLELVILADPLIRVGDRPGTNCGLLLGKPLDLDGLRKNLFFQLSGNFESCFQASRLDRQTRQRVEVMKDGDGEGRSDDCTSEALGAEMSTHHKVSRDDREKQKQDD